MAAAACATWVTHSPQETTNLGEAVGRALVGGLAIALVGPLGVGKTHFVKGVARGNARHDLPEVTSPTFTLVHEYPGRLLIFHVDAYRLNGPDDFRRLGPDEWHRPDAVVVIEWADRIRAALDDEGLWVELTSQGEWARRFDFRAVGSAAAECLRGLTRCASGVR